jgi:hypothetical protein
LYFFLTNSALIFDLFEEATNRKRGQDSQRPRCCVENDPKRDCSGAQLYLSVTNNLIIPAVRNADAFMIKPTSASETHRYSFSTIWIGKHCIV